jgi:hypothetical protein
MVGEPVVGLHIIYKLLLQIQIYLFYILRIVALSEYLDITLGKV